VHAYDWCQKHYTRWLRHGDPGSAARPPRAAKQRSAFDLWDRVLIGDGCWEIQGTHMASGYGTVPWGQKTKSGMEVSHRLAYMLWHGLSEIPNGMFVCHQCDNPPCCRPDHLYLGTHQQNMNDAAVRGRMRNGNSEKTQCKAGHPFDEANTRIYYVAGEPHRACRACKAERNRLYKQRRRSAA
jgi:hypothetical protein